MGELVHPTGKSKREESNGMTDKPETEKTKTHNEAVNSTIGRHEHRRSLLHTCVNFGCMPFKGTEMEVKMKILSRILICLWASGVLSFQPLTSKGSVTHSDITKKGALRITRTVFQQIPNFQGQLLAPNSVTDDQLTAEYLFQAYYEGTVSPSLFNQVLDELALHNAAVDVLYVLSSKRHFDSETLLEGKEQILELLQSVIRGIQQENLQTARKNMGRLLHTLQDFYSHSNWIELGFAEPNSNIIIPDRDIGLRAGKDERTCSNCGTDVCHGNIPESIKFRKVLTTGYFNILPLGKPEGKCSHGGKLDGTRHSDAEGGINKDTVSSPHGYLHSEAARVAILATEEAFGHIREAVGDKHFLRFLNADSPSALSFVIDTTRSMAAEIKAVKEIASSIIDSRQGTLQEPNFYVLVPFNDPDFGPAFKTTNSDKFKRKLSSLIARGGGGGTEMSLSGIQLALTNSAPSSLIYVFTDASAHDGFLENTIRALVQETNSQVYFLLTTQDTKRNGGLLERLLTETVAGFRLYRRIAISSGGLAISLSKQHLFDVTSIIEESTTSMLVTVLQISSRQSHLENPLNCSLDQTIKNITIYITDNPQTITLTNPKGISQSIVDGAGNLANTKTFGNLKVIRLHSTIDPGVWKLKFTTDSDYSVKITGQSLIDFSYRFIEPSDGPHPDFSSISGQPISGRNATLMISVTGLSVFHNSLISHVLLLDVNGEILQVGKVLNLTESTQTLLVDIEMVPRASFFLLVRGEDGMGNVFQRQSSTLISTSLATLTVQDKEIIQSGQDFNLTFTLKSEAPSSTYNLVVRDDQNFAKGISPSSVPLQEGESVKGVAFFSIPDHAPDGTTMTIIIEASSKETSDFNYGLLRLTVTNFGTQRWSKSSIYCQIASCLILSLLVSIL
ncbi:von Willebrand factor A domain-containing protein 7-like [Scyliorhinus torazame]|uniref:von Willebrand factor A domain-containing protein 7-like n=1 Tax=Scyliorhinus torazame TaxID=75743 RepID=UPI003B592F81